MGKVECRSERMIIPTYLSKKHEEMPMYSEYKQHQDTIGYAYPSRVNTGLERETLADKEYDAVILENDYVKLIILPELGGRIWKAIYKKTDYHFFYDNDAIKPVIIGNLGDFIGGGLEFNFPFHHRPTTFMPTDYTIEYDEGSATVWLSEATNSPLQYRMKEMHGIRLYSDSVYFETLVHVENTTSVKRPFLWWANGGINVNDDYQYFFPQDVTWVYHHYHRYHNSFPIAEGYFEAADFKDGTDISMHRNHTCSSSFFAGPSKYNFFGGYDHRKECGTVHYGNHHIVPGKKVFLWGHDELGKGWNEAMASTDEDKQYAELMAGAFTTDQPDFTYLAPYEVKTFKQYWYPIEKVKVPTYANLYAAVRLDKEESKLRIFAVQDLQDAKIVVSCDADVLIEKELNLKASDYCEYDLSLPQDACHILLTMGQKIVIDYLEDIPEIIDMPDNNPGTPAPDKLNNAQDVFIAGRHLDQYRNPVWSGKDYYEEAVRRKPDYVPALLGLAESLFDYAQYDQALYYLHRAEKVINRYDKNPFDGTCSYLKGLCLYYKGKVNEAYNAFFKAAWSDNVISPAMTYVAAIDGQRKNYASMKENALIALSKESLNSRARNYLAIAEYKLGNKEKSLELLKETLAANKLDHLARFLYALYADGDMSEFYAVLSSNPSETCIDLSVSLVDAGCYDEAISLFENAKENIELSTMGLYCLADIYEQTDNQELAESNRKEATKINIVDVFPYRPEELAVLRRAVEADQQDGTAIYLLGCILYDKTFYEEAANCFEKCIEITPEFYIPYRNLAVAYFSKLDRKEEALELLKKACSIKKNDDQLLIEIAFVMTHLNVDGQEKVDFLKDNWPEKPSDNLVWDLGNAYLNIQEYDKAIDVMSNHDFIVAETQEINMTEVYTFAQYGKGKMLRNNGKYEEALECFRAAKKLPENLNAGWWDVQVLCYATIAEAETLMMMNKPDEAKEVAGKVVPFNVNHQVFRLGPAREYFVAMAYKLMGHEVKARKYISKFVCEWEEELKSGGMKKNPATGLTISYVPDAESISKASILAALGYSRLFFSDPEGAKKYFEESLALDPSNMKVKIELDTIL